MRNRAMLLFLLLFFTLAALSSTQRALGEGVKLTLYWDFDNWAFDPAGDIVYIYTPGSIAVMSASIENACDLTFKVTELRVHMEWMSEGEYARLVPPQEIKITPGGKEEIGKVKVEVPPDLPPGIYSYYFEVDVETLYGGEWTAETYTLEGYRDFVVAKGRVELDVDYSTEGGYSFRQGGEARFRIHLANEGGATANVEYVRLYTGWPPGKFAEDEFYECLEPGQEFSLGPGKEVDLECSIPLPSDLPPGRYYSRLEVKTTATLLGVRYEEYWTPDYQMDYEVQEAESFVQKYKEMLGLLTATASAASVIIGVYKKWKSPKSD